MSTSPAADPATASSVRRPDFGAQRKHFIFTDEHEQLRDSIRRFARKELAPHAQEFAPHALHAGTDEIMLDVIGRSYGL
jgi:hypothetical protein